METETEDDFFERGRQLARALDGGEPLTEELKAKLERVAQDNPELPVGFVSESLASLPESREQATLLVPASFVLELVGQVERILAESGAGQGFDAARWVVQWLEQPLPALGNARPVDYVGTAEGRAVVAGLLARMQSSSFS